MVSGVGGLGSVAYAIGLDAVQEGAVGGYKQLLNGTLVRADVMQYTCVKNGGCEHADYSCDPYTVSEPQITIDANGKATTTWVSVTRYETCPQMTEEFTYTVTDSLDNIHVIAANVFAQNPAVWRDHGVNMSGSDQVPRGVPARWQQIKDSIEAGRAEPVTVVDTYANYILPNEKTIHKEHSDDIARLREMKLLPDHTANVTDPVHDNFIADKVAFAGLDPPPNAADWQQAVMRFNAALGMQLQGDLHVVVVRSSRLHGVFSPQDYLQALKAYWLNGLGKDAIAKNGIIVVLGVNDDADKVDWAQSSTGMPDGTGNDGMLYQLNTKLPGKPFTVDAVFGDTRARIQTAPDGKFEPVYTIGEGVIPQITMVLEPFERACMGCEGEEDKGKTGYVYLKTEIPLEGWPMFWTILLYLLTFGLVWFLTMCVYSGVTGEIAFPSPWQEQWSSRKPSDPYGSYNYRY